MNQSLFSILMKDSDARRGFGRELRKLAYWIAGWLFGILIFRFIAEKPLLDDWISPVAGIAAILLCWIVSVSQTISDAVKNESNDNNNE